VPCGGEHIIIRGVLCKTATPCDLRSNPGEAARDLFCGRGEGAPSQGVAVIVEDAWTISTRSCYLPCSVSVRGQVACTAILNTSPLSTLEGVGTTTTRPQSLNGLRRRHTHMYMHDAHGPSPVRVREYAQGQHGSMHTHRQAGGDFFFKDPKHSLTANVLSFSLSFSFCTAIRGAFLMGSGPVPVPRHPSPLTLTVTVITYGLARVSVSVGLDVL